MRKSIRKQLVIWLSLLLGTIWTITAMGGYFMAVKFSNDAFDRELLNSADSVAARIRVKGGVLAIDLPAAAQAILRHDNIDRFYYQVINSRGQRLSGDPFLPIPLQTTLGTRPLFRDAKVGNDEVRIVEVSTSTEALNEHVIVQAVETRNGRKHLSQSILVSIILPQLMMAIFGATAVWFGISLGLNPLRELHRTISSRSPGDLRAFDDSISPEETYPLVTAINKLLEILREDAKAKQRFIANASHQLRTPLAGLKTYSSLGIKSQTIEDMRHIMEQIDKGLDRTSHLVTQLLALARNDSGTSNISAHESIDLNFIVSDTVAGQVERAIKSDIDLRFKAAGSPALIAGDRIGLQQLTDNLIDNALKYTSANGFVEVALNVTSDKVILSVRDSGPGISKDDQTKIFERFYRIDGAPTGGSGLGLAIVRDVADNHNASITVDSPVLPDGGSLFKISFPRHTL